MLQIRLFAARFCWCPTLPTLALVAAVVLASVAPAGAGTDLPPDLIVADSRIQLHGVPRHSYVYNPSLVDLGSGSLMVFRIDDTDGPGSTRIGAVELDADFVQVGEISLLDLRTAGMPQHTAEDPRLLWFDGQIYLVYNMTRAQGRGVPRSLNIAKLHLAAKPDGTLAVSAPMQVGLRVPVDRAQQPIEKNWTPFVHAGAIHMIYTTNPPDVMRVPPEALTGERPIVALDPVSHEAPAVGWPHGEMRGGSPATWDEEKGVYTAFFHGKFIEQFGWKEKHNLTIGFYTFSAHPPFAIEKVTPVAILPEGFHASDTATLSCAYPGGFVRRADATFLVYGYQDKSIHLMKFDTRALWDFLVDVSAL